jgi:hypothetical protein
MYTKSAFPTRLSFTSETSFTSSFPYIPKVCTAFSLSDTRDIFPLLFYFPLFSILTVSKFSLLPQYLVYSSVPHVCFTYQQNTKDSFVYYHENFFLPISLDLLQNTIYILLPFSSCPFQKDVNAIFQISPPMPLINCPVSYYSAYHLFFFLTMSWFFTFKNSLPEFHSHHHCPSSSTASSISIYAVLNCVRGYSILFKFWWKWSNRFCNSKRGVTQLSVYRWNYMLCK